MKQTIAVDIDDVILAEAEFIIDYANKYWGHGLTIDDYREDWASMWAVDAEELEKRIETLHAPGVQTSYAFINGAIEALRQLQKRYTLVVLTSRRADVQQETLDWVDRHLPDLFKEIHFTGFWDTNKPGGHLLTKGELSKQIGADYLIDDQPRHCLAAADAGIEAILFGDYGVSRHLHLPPRVTRCKDWTAVLDYFDGQG